VSVVALVDGVRADALPLDDRGLLYGDGLFETMLARDGRIALWPLHWQRLSAGCARLGITAPARDAVEADIAMLLSGDAPDVVIKLVVTRGSGARGDMPPVDATTRRMAVRHVLAALPATTYDEGVALTHSDVVVGGNPSLAGLKHLGRLEQVLARAALRPDCHDALQSDPRGEIVGATSANVFARIDGAWRTPPVDRYGIAGVCRAALLATEDARAAPCITITPITRDALRRADAVFVTNAVRGVVPVARIDERALNDHIDALAFARRLAARGFVPSGSERWLTP
jgi:4-amino-4-deoxychorismate lyase